jgi:hypothetical protein
MTSFLWIFPQYTEDFRLTPLKVQELPFCGGSQIRYSAIGSVQTRARAVNGRGWRERMSPVKVARWTHRLTF